MTTFQYYMNKINRGFPTKEDLENFLHEIEDSNISDRAYYDLRHIAICKYYGA